MTTRTEQLHQLMTERGVSVARVAEILGRKPQTIRIWRCKDDRRQIPAHALELLRLKLDALQ